MDRFVLALLLVPVACAVAILAIQLILAVLMMLLPWLLVIGLVLSVSAALFRLWTMQRKQGDGIPSTVPRSDLPVRAYRVRRPRAPGRDGGRWR